MPAEPSLRLIRGQRASGTLPSEFSALPDAQLVLLAQSGARDAFEALYRRYVAFALNLAVRLNPSGEEAEDVVHDAFLKAHANLDTLRDTSAFRSWLGAIVVRLVRTRLRRARIQRFLGLAPNNPVDLDALASDAASPQVRAELAQVYGLLGLLSTEDRIAWTLRNVEQRRLEEVAAMCECSLATVKRRIAKAQRFIEENFVATGGNVADGKGLSHGR